MTAFILKFIALFTMIIDHSAAVLYDTAATPLLSENMYLLLRDVGRVAFPLYAFFLVQGFRHTRDWHKYALRLFGLGVLSQIPYAFTLNGVLLRYDMPLWRCFTDLNILFTLTLGVLLLAFMDTKRLDKVFDAPVTVGLMAVLAVLFWLSHIPETAIALGVAAALLVFARFRPQYSRIAGQAARLVLFAFVLFWLMHKMLPFRIFDVRLHFSFDYDIYALILFAALYWAKTARRAAVVLAVWGVWIYFGMWGEIVGALIPAVLIWFYNGERGPSDRRLFYWAYPAHLFILWGVLTLIGG